ncbi:MAG: OmpA family protein [Paludibacter sp.]|nr:OmpA family protein [Paludibacter sp.]
MKKTIFMFAAMLVAFLTVAAQESTETNAVKDYSRWSLALKGGVNQFRIQRDPQAILVNPDKTGRMTSFIDRSSWQGALQIEYTATPYYGIGLEAGYYDYARYQFNGHTIDGVLNSSFNLSNLVSPLRRGFWSKTALYANIGAGVGFYSYKDDDPNVKKENNDYSPVFTGGFNFDINFTPVLALILEGQYRAYTYDNLGGKQGADGSQGAYNNDAWLVNIGLRFKFGANNNVHTRNALVKDYFSDLYQVAPNDEGLRQRVDALEQGLNNLDGDLKNLEPKVSKNTNDIDQLKRDLQRLNGTISDMNKPSAVTASFDNIHFHFNKSTIANDNPLDKPTSFDVLDNIASILKENAVGNKITITGHTDAIGTDAYNQALSLDRATTVKNYLVSKGIPASNISVIGMGEKQPIATNSTADGRAKNRRVQFEISK